MLELMRKWEREIGPQVGLDEMEFEILTGRSARARRRSRHHQVESLAQLEAFFAKIGKIDAHAKWGKEMEPYVVSGTSLWNIYRIVE